MNLLERAQIFLAGMFLSLGFAHFEVVTDFDQAAFVVMGATIICWAVGAIFVDRQKTGDISANVDDAKRS